MFDVLYSIYLYFFFFNDTATTEIYTLSLHDALPISLRALIMRDPISGSSAHEGTRPHLSVSSRRLPPSATTTRSEEHTSELQSRQYLVCRLLLEKKKTQRVRPKYETLSSQCCYTVD